MARAEKRLSAVAKEVAAIARGDTKAAARAYREFLRHGGVSLETLKAEIGLTRTTRA